LLYQQTAESELADHLTGAVRTAYCGFDPTADSLTIGNLIAIKLLMHWQHSGHRPLVLVGGGTGLIGDPSGKDSERPLLTRELVEANLAGQRRIFERLLDFDASRPNAAEIVNNADWLTELGFIDVLRDVGKYFSVNAMIARDSVRNRLEDRAHGISYTEFSYMLLQAYDFLELRRTRDCTVQVAGSDQFGNIVAGIDLIRRDTGEPAFGVTSPLVTHADGRKIGKSEGGAVWLTADRTSPYAFYQYWVNVPDADVGAFLRWFTLLAEEEVLGLEAGHAAAPEKRSAQRALAEHMTDLLHGPEERRAVAQATEALFGGGDPRSVPEHILRQIVEELPHTEHPQAALDSGCPLLELLPETSLAGSKREAREFLKNGAIWINGERATPDRVLRAEDLLPGGFALLRRGKKHWHATLWDEG
jgi:tyrosyl-tRNA synthetase